MSLSLSSRRRYQTPATSASTVTATPSSLHPVLPLRKQHSLIEPSTRLAPSSRYTAQQRGYLSRGLSVGRSIESIRQKLYPPPPPSQSLARQASLATEELSAAAAARLAGRLAPELGVRLREKPLVAWSSTTSLLKGPLPGDTVQPTQRLQEEQKETQIKVDNAKSDKNRINLNIVLAQTIRATNEQETLPSDNECSELSKESVTVGAAEGAAGKAEGSTEVPVADAVACALTVQRRPPLVRAMSAPVRLDESSKQNCGGGILGAAQKRSQQKLRRRKIFTRAASSSVASVPPTSAAGCNPLLATDADGAKKSLSRARSVIAPDVITLVSLLSSEGSDSEREDNSAASTTPTGDKQTQSGQGRSPQRRAPLLRKTGKSVSFQDSYPPTFQLASKEYSHMIRRGSIAPLAARIRANRPPTAPPVSIFLSEGKDDASGTINLPTVAAEEAKKENNAANCNVPTASVTSPPPPAAQQEYNFPLYVCSIKERECWKLHQKMCAKGVSVSYETVLRGMLTPTEFRHFQKQRELEETKAQEAAEAEAEAAAAAENENTKKTTAPSTGIERLSESLLQGK